MRISKGFLKANSNNLPKVNFMMLLEFMRENNTFNLTEIRKAKAMIASGNTVETSVGYVEIKRENSLCYIKGRVAPEYKVSLLLYTVIVTIDETDGVIKDVHCQDCPAGEGCKHSICLVNWLVTRPEEPLFSTVCSYWTKPLAISENDFILAKDLAKSEHPDLELDTIVSLPSSSSFLTLFLNESKKRNMKDSLIFKYFCDTVESLDKYSIYQLMFEFVKNSSEPDYKFFDFKMFAEYKLSPDILDDIEKQTRGRTENQMWLGLKQARVSALDILAATKCKFHGDLVESILSGYKAADIKVIKRGKALRKKVITEIENNFNIKIKSCGFKLITPFIWASPDGICEEKNFVLQIKCPRSEKAMARYIKEGATLSDKCKAQAQLQMYAMKTKKALVCVADPKYDENKRCILFWENYRKLYVEKYILEGEDFWKKFIYEKILDIVK